MNTIQDSAALLLSGGIDSTTLLYYLLSKGVDITCISFNYGQKHSKELESARYFSKQLGVKHEILDLTSLSHLFSKSSLIGDQSVSLGPYSSESLKSTVVPNRNMIMLSIACSYAISNGIKSVAYAAHSGDHITYHDCRPEFVVALDQAFSICDASSPRLLAPFLHKKKSDIISLARNLGVDLSKTWSCYAGKDSPCGECGTCIEISKALETLNENLQESI